MANKTLYALDGNTGKSYPLKLVDNGDGTYSLSVSGATGGGGVTGDFIFDANGLLKVGLYTQLDSTNDSVTAAQGNAGSATSGWYTRFARPSTSGLTEAAINAAASGDNTIVAAVAAQTVRVMKLFLTVAQACTLTFKSGAGTSLTGAITLSAGASIVLDLDGEPWFTTGSGSAFVINLSAAVQMSGRIYYTQS